MSLMPTDTERRERLDAIRPEAAQLAEGLRTHHRAQVQVSERAETVLGHPGWQTYVDHIDAILEDLDQRIARGERALINASEPGESLTGLRLGLRDLKGERRGWEGAREMIPRMIEAGEKARQALA